MYTDLKVYYNVFRGTENHVSVILRIFSYKCATFVVPFVFWYTKNVDVDNFYSKSLRSMAKIFIQIYWLYIMCFVEQTIIFCYITYFPHKCATFVVPFVFWYTKMPTLTILTQNRWGVWLKFVYRFNGLYNVFCGTEIIFCYITYFLTIAPPLWFPLYFGIQKCWR